MPYDSRIVLGNNEQDIGIGSINNETERSMCFEQYKIVVESINTINAMREISNQFWIAANAIAVSGLVYFRDCDNIIQQHKIFILITVTLLGLVFCLSWVSYLLAVKKSIEIRSTILLELEKNFPMGVFSKIFARSGHNSGKAIFTIKEIIVPCLFTTSYCIFSVLIFMFPQYCFSK